MEKAEPLAPGMLASIYGEHLGPQKGCTGQADLRHSETPNPRRLDQTAVELQVFPKRLCGTEVTIGGISAGLLYVQASQVNFKVPQDVPDHSALVVRVVSQGVAGPEVVVALGRGPGGGSAAELASEIWANFERVGWNTRYEGGANCRAVAANRSGGIVGYAFSCFQPGPRTTASTFYYPTDPEQPALLLRRADFRLADPYPARSAEVEQLLRTRLIKSYGPGNVTGPLSEIGLNGPGDRTSWHAGGVTLFLHRNRTYTAPNGVQEGVVLLAIRQEVLAERAGLRDLETALSTTSRLSPPVLAADLNHDLAGSRGGLPLAPLHWPLTEERRADAELEVSSALFRLLRSATQGERNTRAAKLVAADELTVRLGEVLVVHTVNHGSVQAAAAPDAVKIRHDLEKYGIRYTGPGHYSGFLEYDRNLLRRAWREFPETGWGQRALLLLQRQSCTAFGPPGTDEFRSVIKQGLKFLRDFPETPFRREQTYHLALAYETWWSLSQAESSYSTAEVASVAPGSDRARLEALSLYQELAKTAPESPEGRAGQFIIPRLRMKLDTGGRTFYCDGD